MGTSSSNKGAGGDTPLIPTWLGAGDNGGSPPPPGPGVPPDGNLPPGPLLPSGPALPLPFFHRFLLSVIQNDSQHREVISRAS